MSTGSKGGSNVGNTAGGGGSLQIWGYCSLLALQYGLQPMISSTFSAPRIAKSSIVIGTEIAKILIAAVSIFFIEPAGTFQKIRSKWTIRDSLRVAFVPASLYAIQNLLVQHSYVYLDSMTFNVLNQLKVMHILQFWSPI
jgi:UDP-sugar transporter A1/2/3